MANGGHRFVAGRWRLVAIALVISVSAVACGGDEEPELTFEDQLVELEGRSLTPAEVAERVEVGETLCGLDDRVLDELWQQLSEDQLHFQDLIVAELCPERAVLYAGHTGRFVTDEAENSGVRTSTTRPTSTTSTTSRATTTRPPITAATTGNSADGSDPSATSTTEPAAPSSATSAPTTTLSTTPSTTASTSSTRPTTSRATSTSSPGTSR